MNQDPATDAADLPLRAMTLTTPAPRRILEVIYSFRVGGSELLGLELARDLRRAGNKVFCTALDGMSGPLRERCADYDIEVVDLGLPMQGALSRNGVSLALTRRLRSLQLDAIHLQHFLGLNKLGMPARLAGIQRVVVTEHSVLDTNQSPAGRVRIRLNWRMAHAITVIHPSIKDYLVGKLGLDPERVKVIPVGIDLASWQREDRAACRANLGITDEFVFAFAGRLAPVKNIPDLISVFLAAQLELATKSKLLIVGDGEDMQACRDIAAGHPNGAAVILKGEQRDVRPFLAATDAFIMNSHSEGTPRALLEAMALGLPGIATAVGGIPDILNGRGWLVEPANQSAMRAAIADAASSPEKARHFGTLAREYVAFNYDTRNILQQYQQLFATTGS